MFTLQTDGWFERELNIQSSKDRSHLERIQYVLKSVIDRSRQLVGLLSYFGNMDCFKTANLVYSFPLPGLKLQWS